MVNIRGMKNIIHMFKPFDKNTGYIDTIIKLCDQC